MTHRDITSSAADFRRPGQHDQRHRPYTNDAAGGSAPGHLRSQGATCPLLWANAEARPGSCRRGSDTEHQPVP